MDACVISIRNWPKYQGEAKRFRTTDWFRWSNKFHEHLAWHELNDAELRVMLYLMMQISRRAHQTGEFPFIVRIVAHQCLTTRETVISTIQKLSDPCDIISFKELSLRESQKWRAQQAEADEEEGAPAELELPSQANLEVAEVTEPKEERADSPPEKNSQSKTARRVPRACTERSPCSSSANSNSYKYKNNITRAEIAAAAKAYPRGPEGIAAGIEKAGSALQSREEFESLKAAIQRFQANHEAKKTPKHLIPFFSSFLNYWRDWQGSSGLCGFSASIGQGPRPVLGNPTETETRLTFEAINRAEAEVPKNKEERRKILQKVRTVRGSWRSGGAAAAAQVLH